MATFSFSKQARSLWAKKPRSGELLWLSLPVHLADAAETAQWLWRHWVPEGVKNGIASSLSSPEMAENLLVFLAASHDLGKAAPVFASQDSGYRELDNRIFERMLNVGLPIRPRNQYFNARMNPHALISQILLEEGGCPQSVAVILGAHHGKPADANMLVRDASRIGNYYDSKQGMAAWQAVQQELIRFALHRAGFASLQQLPDVHITGQVLLAGLLITVDWIVSDTRYFPLVKLDDASPDSRVRAAVAQRELSFTKPWQTTNRWMQQNFFLARFGFSPNALQQAVWQALNAVREPGILVIEGPMGVGKTEAALAAAEAISYMTKRRGVFFALPTQATSDGIFTRIVQWIDILRTEETKSIQLLHGKSQFNNEFRNLANGDNMNVDEAYDVFVHEWFTGRKRALLDDFVVGTIDQLLLAGLKQKHVMLRHLGLASKVVIVDEVHAYDAYMSEYLERALNWLGAYGVPVIILSATLPVKRRQALIEAYNNRRYKPDLHWTTSRAYPAITYSNGQAIEHMPVKLTPSSNEVRIAYLDETSLVAKLTELLAEGGCAGVIVNSVRKAQQITKQLQAIFGKDVVHLLHARLLLTDRLTHEKTLMQELGKPTVSNAARPRLRIVVGSQVLEQSLDIDFDVLITDICPIDLLLQRIGRLHRHERLRPFRLQQAKCFVIGVFESEFDSASHAIYGDYLLMRTVARLPPTVRLPQDISEMVQDVYDDEVFLVDESDAYADARAIHNKRLQEQRKKADTFRMRSPIDMDDMIGWLHTDVPDSSGKRGEAAVRDTVDTLEVIVVQRREDGQLAFLPWIEKGKTLDKHLVPDEYTARQIAKCTVRLPAIVGGYFNQLDRTITELEQTNLTELASWQQSPWLRGELFLIVDEQLSATLGDYHLTYHQQLGLEYEKKGDEVNFGGERSEF